MLKIMPAIHCNPQNQSRLTALLEEMAVLLEYLFGHFYACTVSVTCTIFALLYTLYQPFLGIVLFQHISLCFPLLIIPEIIQV